MLAVHEEEMSVVIIYAILVRRRQATTHTVSVG